jgi:hypothetical protein
VWLGQGLDGSVKTSDIPKVTTDGNVLIGIQDSIAIVRDCLSCEKVIHLRCCLNNLFLGEHERLIVDVDEAHISAQLWFASKPLRSLLTTRTPDSPLSSVAQMVSQEIHGQRAPQLAFVASTLD